MLRARAFTILVLIGLLRRVSRSPLLRRSRRQGPRREWPFRRHQHHHRRRRPPLARGYAVRVLAHADEVAARGAGRVIHLGAEADPAGRALGLSLARAAVAARIPYLTSPRALALWLAPPASCFGRGPVQTPGRWCASVGSGLLTRL